MPPTYRRRHRARLTNAEVGGIEAKVRWIDARGGEAPPDLLAAALTCARAAVPTAMTEEGGDEGAAYLILHRGEMGTWLLMHSWAHGDILCARLAHAAPDSTAFAAADARPLVACVWELRVVADERRAWVEHMMTGAPDRPAWTAA